MRISKQWFEHSPKGRFAYLISRLPDGPVRILDVGNVGEDNSSHDVLQKVIGSRPGSFVVGCDIDVDAALEAGHANQTIGDVFQLPFQTLSFDVVYMGEVIEHLWDPRAALQEVARCLHVGGRLVLTTPNVFAITRMLNWWLRHLDTVGHPDHKFLYSPACLVRLMESTGFKIIDLCSAKLHISRIQIPWLPGGKRLGSYLCATAVKID